VGSRHRFGGGMHLQGLASGAADQARGRMALDPGDEHQPPPGAFDLRTPNHILRTVVPPLTSRENGSVGKTGQNDFLTLP
jgi:hypothetical protein